MKPFTIIHVVFLLILLLMYHCSAAQDYLVTTRGDTIRGELRPLMFGLEKKVQVRTDSDKEVYSLLQTRFYSINNVSYYPVKAPYGYTFMELVKSGYLSMFRFQPENSTIFSATFLQKADGTGIELPNLGFRKQMTAFLSDCEQISARIESGELKKSDIDEIVDGYNACIQNRTVSVKREIEQHFEAKSTLSVWEDLEKAVTAGNDFENRGTVLEMIGDIKNRITRKEKVPNFILEGLRSALSDKPDLEKPLSAALSSVKE